MHSDDDTVAQLESSPPPDSGTEDLEEITARKFQNEIAYRVFRDLWKDFDDWESTYCSDTLSQLSRTPYIRPPTLPKAYQHMHWKVPVYEADEQATVEDIDPLTGSSTRVRISWDALHVTKWKPYPRYTACTPSSRNMKKAEDHKRRAKYAAFADDGNFNLRDVLRPYADFAWQNDYVDPDLEMIETEVARRLLYKHNFRIEEIDDLEILTHHLRETNNAGLIWYSQQRDFPPWRDDKLPSLKSDWVDSSLGPYENVTKDIPTFCANLNCIVVNCGLHKPSLPITPPQPTMTREMIRQEGQPCKNDCYKSTDENNINVTNNHWDEIDKSLFRGVMKLTPDTSPCDLAIICRKPCIEMYVERLNFFSDEDIKVDDEPGDQRLPNFRPIKFTEDNEVDPKMTTPPSGPCFHPGPCNKYANCVCYRNKHRCLRDCRCSLKCEIRYEGCKCRPSKRHGKTRYQAKCCVDDEGCLCKQLKRECDPELCKGCSAKYVLSTSMHKSNCQNSDLQKGIFVPIRVKECEYGLGAFATAPIKSQTYIGEYVAELIIEDGNSFLSPLQHHVGLNYTFGIYDDGKFLLDSWDLGNETRYLNHSANPNCEASTIYVNGVHRIKLYALEDIKSGAELTLDYGGSYWTGYKAAPKEYPEDSFDPANAWWETYYA